MSDTSNVKETAAVAGAAPCSATCSECNWTNISLLNLGEPGKPRWVCQGCCKRALEALDAIRAALSPNSPVRGAQRPRQREVRRERSPDGEQERRVNMMMPKRDEVYVIQHGPDLVQVTVLEVAGDLVKYGFSWETLETWAARNPRKLGTVRRLWGMPFGVRREG